MLSTYLTHARNSLRQSLLIGFFTAVTFCSQAAANGNCPQGFPTVTFLQVWQDDVQLTSDDWRQHFTTLESLGFSNVVLQWTRYDKFSLLHDDDAGAAGALDKIVAGAADAGVCLWIGLTYDPRFWEQAAKPDTQSVDDYLDWRLEETELRLDDLSGLWGDAKHEPCGWYITDEFDDDTWGDDARLSSARDYITTLAAALKATADRPVTMSFFSNGNTTPEKLGQFVSNLIGEAHVDKIYMQDGVGAGKLTPVQARERLLSVAQTIAQPVAPIIELFVAQGSDWVPSNFERIAKQLETDFIEIGAVFSASAHLVNGKRGVLTALGEKWSACVGS